MSALALLVFAHLGHWYVQLAFAGPALVIIAYLARDSIRRRLRERREGSDSPTRTPDSPSREP